MVLFQAAARRATSQRPVAHFRSAASRPESIGKAERENQTVEEGLRTFLLQSGLSEA